MELKQNHRVTWASGDYDRSHRAYHGLPPEKAADGKVRWGREYLLTLATRP